MKTLDSFHRGSLTRNVISQTGRPPKVSLISWLIWAIVLASCPGLLQAETYVNRVGPNQEIRAVTLQTTTWTLSGSPYIIENNVTIDAPSTLTVEPGVEVLFSGLWGIYANGKLIANDAAFAPRNEGYWAGIYFGPSANGSVLDGCTVHKAGGKVLGYYHAVNRQAAIYIDASAVRIANCTVSGSGSHGIELWHGSAAIQNNSFQDLPANGYAVLYDTSGTIAELYGNSFAGTGIAGVYVPGGGIGGTNTWNYPGSGFSYYLDGDFELYGSSQLTIEPGVTVKTAGRRIRVIGTLKAFGTPQAPIVFTSRNQTPAAGDWLGIYFGSGAGDSELAHVTVEYAGAPDLVYAYGANRTASIFVDSSRPAFDHLTVANSQLHGIELYASRSTFDNLVVKDCGGHALKAQVNSWPTINRATFTRNGTSGNGLFAISTDASSVPDPINVTFSENRLQGVQITGGTLSIDALWKNWGANAPYVVTSDVTFNGDNLTIEQGATIKFSMTGLYVYGSLIAEGDPGQTTFTSLQDDSVAGDTNGNGDSVDQNALHWKGIYLSSNSSGSVFSNCLFSYAGRDNLVYAHGAYRLAALYLDGCSPAISGCTISDSLSNGIELWDSAATITNSQFKNVGASWYAIVCDRLVAFPVLSSNTTEGTGILGISVPGGTIAGNYTWNLPGPDFPYFVNGDLTLAAGVELIIEPGVTVKTRNRLHMLGTLYAQGAAAAPITFTSSNKTPLPGDWHGIYFGPNASGSVLSHVTVSYAGRDTLIYAHAVNRLSSIYIDLCSPAFDNLTVANSSANGIELYAASATFTNLAVSGCGGHGLKAEAGSRPQITTASFTGNGAQGNGWYTVGTDASSVPEPSNVTFKDNKLQGIQIWGGTLASDADWKNWSTNAPYVVTKDITVTAESLSIQEGATVKFSNSGLYVLGTLTANGDPNRITFTSWADDTAGGDSNGDGTNSIPAAGNWKGVYLSPASGESVFNTCAFRYAGAKDLGYFHAAYRQTTVYVDTCSPTFNNCSITDSAGYGIELWSSSAAIQNSQFMNFGGYYAIALDTLDCNPLLSGNTMTGTGLPGIYLPGGNIASDITWHNPGQGLVYFLTGELSVAEGKTLTIEPGVTVLASPHRLLVYGTLDAIGTDAEPIVFTSRGDNPAPGDWKGIYFGPGAGGSRLSHVTVAYAGRDNIGYIHSVYRYSALYIDLCSPVFDNLTVTRSSANGIEIFGSNAKFNDISIIECLGHAFKAESGSRPIINNASFRGNGAGGSGSYTIGMDASCVPDPINTTFITNRLQGVQIWGGALGANALWKNWSTNAPYVITHNTTVNSDVTLAIEQGTTVKFQNSYLYVYGPLIANGDPGQITFTSWLDDAAGGDSNGDGTNSVPAVGNWKGIYLSPASGASVFKNCAFRYAGGDNLGYIHSVYRLTTMFIDSCSPTLSNCAFENSRGDGIQMWSSNSSIRDSAFNNMGASSYSIVFLTLDTFPKMIGNSALGTGWPGISVPGGAIGISGVWPNPGTNFAYYLNGDLTLNNNVLLRLDPGVTVLSGGPGLYVYGALLAQGIPDQPITFASRNATPAAGDWKGIYFGTTAGNSVMKSCVVTHGGKDSLGYIRSAYRRASIYVDGCSPKLHNLIVAHGAVYGLELFASGATISSSLIYSNSESNIRLDGQSTPLIVNNTIVQSITGGGINCYNASPLIVNNILALNKTDGIRRDNGAPESRYNCYFGNARSNYFGTVFATNDLTLNPQFIDADAGDYHLAQASPCINAGDNSVVEPHWMDLDGRLRIHAQRVDVGAFEFGAPLAVHLIDSMIRNAGETVYTGEEVYSVDMQTKTQTVDPGATAIYHVKLTYKGNIIDSPRILGSSADKGWSVKYFDALTGGNDVSSQVNSAGWELPNLNPDSSIEFRVEVTPGTNVAGNASMEVLVTAISNGNPTKTDSVKAVTVNAVKNMTDAMIRRARDIRYVGRTVYNNTGAGQTKLLELDAGQTGIFHVQISNQGNTDDSFLIRGPAGSSGWLVRYFASLTGTNDISAPVTSAGWTSAKLPGGASMELRIEVTASTNVTAGSAFELLINATSTTDNSKSDTVKAVAKLSTPSTTPEGATYTLDDDFEKGVLAGVEYQTVHDQLQLAKEAITLPFIWAPNSDQGTVSKVDTRTGRELGRYRTSPNSGASPSRTTVDQQGNCWVANRVTGAAVKIGLYENGQYVDRNGNGIIETSQDLNGDGDITGDELLPWGQDECVLFEIILIPGKEGTFVPGTYQGGYANDNWNPGPRGVAVDAKGNVWIGTSATKTYYYVEGASGKILRTNDVSSVNHTAYGAVIDANGILWSSGQDKRHVLRLDPSDNSFSTIPMPHFVYGLGIDLNNHLFVSGWEDSKLTRVNVVTGEKDWTANGFYQSRGIAVTGDGDVWVANSGPGTVTRWSNDGKVKTEIAVGNTPTGVAVDSAGKVWVVNYGDEYIKRIDPATDKVDLEKRIIGAIHYGYSDMTGIIARTATTKYGRWTVIHNAKVKDTPWGIISWHSSELTGASIQVRVRSSNDLQTWSLWEKTANGIQLRSTPPGKYLEVEALFNVTAGDESPILYDLTVTPAAETAPGEKVYSNNFQTDPGPEWSNTKTDVTPLGDRRFLGQFGNTNITLTLTNLPPHSAVIVAFDLFVIRSWDGNSETDGPDKFELNVAGGLKLIHSTFNNYQADVPENRQAYPDPFPGGSHPAQTGAAEVNTLGFAYKDLGVMDSVYRLSFTTPHTADSLILNFIGSGLNPDLAEESWGLDNVQVNIIPLGKPPRLEAIASLPHGEFQLRLHGNPQQSYVIEASPDLVNWAPVSTNALETDKLDWIDAEAKTFTRRFYRASEHK